MTTYILRILAEPDEAPAVLSQEQFDLLMDLGVRVLHDTSGPGASADAAEGSLVDFATLETDPASAPFIYRGVEVSPERVAEIFEAVLADVIASSLGEAS